MRREISPEELTKYRTLETPAVGSFLVRPLRYSEIRTLNEFEELTDEKLDGIILACTNLTSQSLDAMPDIDRDYIAFQIRSMSFIDTRFDVLLECGMCNEEGNIKNDKIGMEEFEFVPPSQEFFEKIDFIIPTIRSYGARKIAESLPADSPEWKRELFVLASYATEDQSLNGIVEMAERLEENGLLAQNLADRLSEARFGLQPTVRKWKCPKCGAEHSTEVDPADFFRFPPSH